MPTYHSIGFHVLVHAEQVRLVVQRHSTTGRGFHRSLASTMLAWLRCKLICAGILRAFARRGPLERWGSLATHYAFLLGVRANQRITVCKSRVFTRIEGSFKERCWAACD